MSEWNEALNTLKAYIGRILLEMDNSNFNFEFLNNHIDIKSLKEQ